MSPGAVPCRHDRQESALNDPCVSCTVYPRKDWNCPGARCSCRFLAKQLLDQFGIFTVHRTGIAAGACVRITPALFTTRDHIDGRVRALEVITA